MVGGTQHLPDWACIKSSYDRRLADLRAARGSSQAGKPAAIPHHGCEVLSASAGNLLLARRAAGFGRTRDPMAEFKHVDSQVRIDADRAVFSHYDQSGNSQNIVAVSIADGSARNLAEGVPGGRFVAEDARYLVYSSHGADANPLVVFDKRANKRAATVRLKSPIS